ncbi:papain-like cysteine protease family protein [Pseudomonas syringae]|uniref:Papain-like cysteine protease family protein n=1 Tax=Pseudomonas syringae CC1417 TaxID=1357272 RepID=A0AAU8LFI3_PSESX
MTNLTLVNNVSDADAIVTYKITDGAGTTNKLTVPGGGGSVSHPTDSETSPWSVLAITATGAQLTSAQDQTAILIVTDPNAIIHFAVDPVFGVLATTQSAPPPQNNPVTPITPAAPDDGLGGDAGVSGQSAASALDNQQNWDAPAPVNAAVAQTSLTLPFAMQPQQQTNWCWAAVSVSTALFYDLGNPATQCALANQAFGDSNNCCVNGSSGACNQPYFLNLALSWVGHLNNWYEQAFTLAQIMGEIDARHPLGARIGWNGGGGHFVAIYGYNTNVPAAAPALSAPVAPASTPASAPTPAPAAPPATLSIADPWFGVSVIAMTDFAAHYQGGGTWTHSYTTH